MKKVFQRMLSLILTLALIVGMVGVVPTKVEAADDVVTWKVYEVSLFNNLGAKPAGTYTVGSSTGLNSISGNASSKNTFITQGLDYDYSININSNGNTCSLDGISLGNQLADSVTIEVPDLIEHYFISSIVRNEDDSYTVTVSKVISKVTSISNSFDSKCVASFGSTDINLIVTKEVTKIEQSAFEGNTNLRSVSFKGDIQTIESDAFADCNGLETLDLSKTFRKVNNNTIPEGCFYNCTQLTDVVIPDSIIHIGSEAFYGCNKLDTIKLTDRIETVGKNAFGACSNLRYIYIESDASDWTNIVKSNEVYKLITDLDGIKPLVTVKGSNSDLDGKYIFSPCSISIFSKVDMDSIEVRKDGVLVEDIYDYVDKTYVYKTNAYYFNILQNQKGVYTITATDVEGNTCTKTFSYLTDKEDKTAPVISISGVGSADCYQSATLKFEDKDTYIASSLLNDEPIDSGYTVKEEGKYELVVTDVIDNVARKTFYVDKTAPTISGIDNGAVSKKGVSISLSDNLAGIKSVTCNGVAQDTSGFTVYNSGVYEVIAVDKALNQSKLTFTIDSIGPTADGLINNKYYNAPVTLKFSSICGVIEAKLDYKASDGSNKTIDVTDGYVCKADGQYSLKLKDALGNSSSYKFVIDTIKPSVKGVKNNKYYRSKSIKLSISDENLDKATLNGDSISKSKTIKDEGKYTLVVTDKAGNTQIVKFTIDRTKPKCTVKNGKTYKRGVKIWGSDKVSGIKSVKLDKKTIKKKTKCKKRGTHKVIITDKAGNKTTVKFKVR